MYSINIFKTILVLLFTSNLALALPSPNPHVAGAWGASSCVQQASDQYNAQITAFQQKLIGANAANAAYAPESFQQLQVAMNQQMTAAAQAYQNAVNACPTWSGSGAGWRGY